MVEVKTIGFIDTKLIPEGMEWISELKEWMAWVTKCRHMVEKQPVDDLDYWWLSVVSTIGDCVCIGRCCMSL